MHDNMKKGTCHLCRDSTLGAYGLVGQAGSRPRPLYLLTDCTLDYDHCQVNWFMLCLLQTTDRNDHSTYGISLFRTGVHV